MAPSDETTFCDRAPPSSPRGGGMGRGGPERLAAVDAGPPPPSPPHRGEGRLSASTREAGYALMTAIGAAAEEVH